MTVTLKTSGAPESGLRRLCGLERTGAAKIDGCKLPILSAIGQL